MLPVEKWRRKNNLTHQELANLLGCSRTYATNICRQGTKGVAKAVRLIAISKGALTLEDLLRPEDREELIRDGFLKSVEDVAEQEDIYNI